MRDRLDISVVGAGQMGVGFAIHFRLYEQSVTVIDHREENLTTARNQIRDTIAFLDEHDVEVPSAESVLDGITFTLDLEAGAAGSDIVLETVAEDLDIKREVFETLGEATSPETILASNTSGIQITEIADGFSFADRIVGCHWLYPPYLLPTVEVIRGEETADETVDDLAAFVEAVGRKPIRVERDVPGFVWNRVQFAVLRECLHLVEDGVASVEDVNTAIRDGYARRTAVIGPFETVDLAGLDLFSTVAAGLYPSLADTKTPSPIFDEYLDSGRRGVDSGSGFFDYDSSPTEVERTRDEYLIALDRTLGGKTGSETGS